MNWLGNVAMTGAAQPFEERLWLPLDDEHVAMRRREKAMITRLIEKLQERIVEAIYIEQANRLEVQPELQPRERLEDFLERPHPARQRDKHIRHFRHAHFAFVHGIHRDELGDPMVPAFLGDHLMWDDADHFPTRDQRCIRQHTHEPHAAATVDDADSTPGTGLAKRGSSLGVNGRLTKAGAGVDTNSRHAR